MKIIQLNEEQKVYFSGLDPFEILDKTQNLKSFCLGTAIPGDDYDIPTGLMICLAENNVLIIRWLYVAPEYRGQGYGDALISKAFEFASKAEYEHVCAYIPFEYGRKFVCPFEEEYLKGHAFDRVLIINDKGGRLLAAEVAEDDDALLKVEPYNIFEKLLEQLEEEERAADASLMKKVDIDDQKEEEETKHKTISITAGEVKNSALLSKSKSDTGNVVGVMELTLPKLGRGIRRCLKKHSYVEGGIDIEKDLETLSPEWFDTELSSCAMNDDEVCGLFLIHKSANGEYWTEYLYDVSKHSKQNLMNMLKRSAAIFSEYPEDTKINIRITNKESEALLQNLFSK